MSKKNAMDAVEATRDTHQAAWEKMGKVIAKKKLLGKDFKQVLRLKTRIASKIGRYNSRLLEIKAASNVIAAPSVAEVKKVQKLLKSVRNIAIKDAMLKAGFKMIKDALASSAKIAAKVKV